MWRQLLLVLTIFVVASSATKGARRPTSLGTLRRNLQDETKLEPPSGPAEPPVKEEKKGPKKEEKEKKEKKCKVKEKKTKDPSTALPPPAPTPLIDGQGSDSNTDTIVTDSNLVGGTSGTYSWNGTSDEELTAGSDATRSTNATVVGNPLVSSAEVGNATLAEEDLPFCSDEENPDRLATEGANIGKLPIAASALGLVTIVLAFIGYKYYRDRKSRDFDDKICVPNLYAK